MFPNQQLQHMSLSFFKHMFILLLRLLWLRACSRDPTRAIKERLRHMLHVFLQHNRANARNRKCKGTLTQTTLIIIIVLWRKQVSCELYTIASIYQVLVFLTFNVICTATTVTHEFLLWGSIKSFFINAPWRLSWKCRDHNIHLLFMKQQQ